MSVGTGRTISVEDRRAAVDGLRELARFAVTLTYDELPSTVVDRATHVLVNNVACAILGTEHERLGPLGVLPRLWGQGQEATLIGSSERVSTPLASLMHGTRINATELSEGVSKGVVHPGSVIIPSVLAEAERLGSSGQDVLRAIVAGYEVLVRCGWTLAHDPRQPLDTVQAQSLHRGWYPPALLGGYGVVAALGSLHGAAEETVVQAFGIVGNLSPTTTLAAFQHGVDVKPMGNGWASALGVLAIHLAEAGLTGDPEIAAELFPLLVEPYDFSRFTAGLREVWEIMTLDVKFVAAGPVLCEVECGVQLLERNPGLDPAEIVSVDIETNARTMLLDDPRPTAPSAAKFSTPYCVAQALLGASREAFIADVFKQSAIDESAWHDLADKVSMELNEEYNRAFETQPPVHRPSKLTVTTRDGSVVTHEIRGALGIPGYPPSEEDFLRKYRYIAGRTFSAEQVERQECLLLGIRHAADVTTLMGSLTP